MKINTIIQGDCLIEMKNMPDNSIDMVLTSPPYDNLRDYKGYTFDFEAIANELFRITKQGGVVVWVVGDATIKGSETGTSFKQALYFKEIGFNLHDTMIWQKNSSIPQPQAKRYEQRFEYLFIFSKGTPETFNPITEKRKWDDSRKVKSFHRNNKGEHKFNKFKENEMTKVGNVVIFNVGGGHVTKDEIAYNHPAIFPEKLAGFHIKSWSNEGDLILDPMCGSGTTCKMAKLLKRKYIGIDISEEYCEIANKRLAQEILL